MLACAPFSPAPEVVDEPDFLRIKTGIPMSIMNGVFRTRLRSDVARVKVAETAAYFNDLGLPFEWWVAPDGEPEDLAEILIDSGFKLDSVVPGMVLEDVQSFATLTQPAGFSFKPADDEETIQDLLTPLQAFGLGEAVEQAYLNFCRGWASPHSPARHVVAYADDMPVACGLVFFGAREAGLYTIATVKERRGLGYGAALTSQLLILAKEKGYDRAVLTSSKLGYPVYERLGFKEQLRIAQYKLEPTSDGH